MKTPELNRVGYMEFKKVYPKLNLPFFPTIRKTKKYGKAGDPLLITLSNNGGPDKVIGRAKILARNTFRLRDIPLPLLYHDTSKNSLESALEELRRYYPKLDKNDHVELYICAWTRRGSSDDS